MPMALRIEVAPVSSFCPGVARAVKTTEKELEKGGRPIYSCGPLIHNPAVVEVLSEHGLEILDESHEGELSGATVIIRSHGIDSATEERLSRLGARLVDATCPTVKRAQDAARRLLEENRAVVVVGSSDHPEVRAIAGRAGGPVAVVADAAAAREWAGTLGKPAPPVGVIAQTTVARDAFRSVVEALGEAVGDVKAVDTLCTAVEQRQEEAVDLAGRVDLLLVVGGRNSSNTRTLAHCCESAGAETHLIEDPGEIELSWLAGVGSVGVTGGASTPDWLIERTVERLVELSAETAG
ncbi:MAG: 4-hydroxy-3-methylbut-2-enyl diphosphate reductase [Actinobacteria bacterium]|nr:4-hydroxy-3-methylbut-2-enyl diphosphate reductase [Actinomycetota bacterium]MBU1943104.1 4-hydroxy-3-methylbut-2-enyl diphosphate reductase [Actinomycetota bacterium]MBU2687949.1 4-hydroxy-3-methylbut-2-enyl diphosphate reductase [Actinomycetota bacterium]